MMTVPEIGLRTCQRALSCLSLYTDSQVKGLVVGGGRSVYVCHPMSNPNRNGDEKRIYVY